MRQANNVPNNYNNILTDKMAEYEDNKANKVFELLDMFKL